MHKKKEAVSNVRGFDLKNGYTKHCSENASRGVITQKSD